MKNPTPIIGLLFALLIPGCGGDDDPAVDDDKAKLQQQITRGVTLYTDNCATCHGAMGEGTTRGPPVVGMGVFPKDPRPGAVRTTQFSTALDVFSWAKQNMPPTAPGTIVDDDLLAIFAFDLDANGVQLDKPLDGAKAGEIVLNP